MNTLVVHTGGIGDILLACPAVATLAAHSTVDLLGRPERLALARMAGAARTVLDLDTSGFESLFTGHPSPLLRRLMESYSHAVVWMRDEDHQIANGLQACGLIEVRCFPGIPPVTWDRHASAYYFDCLGLEPTTSSCRITLPQESPVRDVLIHPGSGSPRKNWPRDRFEVVTERLAGLGYRIGWTAGPAEEHLIVPRCAERIAPLNLESLAYELNRSRCYLGNDSGITHLATAVGIPVVALFGPTNPAVWAPVAPGVTVLQGEPWPDTDAVWDAVLHALGQAESTR